MEEASSPRKRGRRLTPAAVVAQVLAVYALTERGGKKGNIAETARVCRVSRRTVRKILTGTHGQHSPNLGSTLSPEEIATPPTRCDECGQTCTVSPCRRCKGLADLRKLQSLAGAANANSPAGLRPRRPRGKRDAAGQRFLPLLMPDGHRYELEPLVRQAAGGRQQAEPDNFELKPKHRRRLNQVKRRQVRSGLRTPIDPENLPF